MLNFSKLLSVLFTISMLNACGYQSPNSDKFPHKHIQELTPETTDLEFKWFKSPADTILKVLNENFIVYDCSIFERANQPKRNLKICSYDLRTHQQLPAYFVSSSPRQLIQQIEYLGQNQFLVTIRIFQADYQSPTQAYLFNAQTQTFTQISTFSYDQFAYALLEQMVQEKTYQKKVSEHDIMVYFDPQYVSEKEAEKVKQEQKQQEQSFIQNIIDIFRTKPEQPQRNFSPNNYRVQPAEPFNLAMIAKLKQYLQQQQAECYQVIDEETQLIKTSKNYIFSQDFSKFLPKLEHSIELPECKTAPKPIISNDKYLKYQSIDDVQGSGNHYIFWFTPIGYDVFEIQQHGKTIQFKLPLEAAQIYRVSNDLIVINAQTYYIIPLS